MTEKQKFIARLQVARAQGLQDLHFSFAPDAKFEDEEAYYKAMNETWAATDDPAMCEDFDFGTPWKSGHSIDKHLSQRRFSEPFDE